ncbi:coagulation factor 5/8 type domain-containing protein, partial [Streptomyces sp. NPDC054835]
MPPTINALRRRRLAALVVAAATGVLLPAVSGLTTATAAAGNFAQGRPVTTSTTESSTLGGAKAVDGSTSTRWASA